MGHGYFLVSTYPGEGSRNVGDALITHSLRRLLTEVRRDVTVADQVFRETPLERILSQINESRALLLPGFAIRDRTWPVVYRLTERLEDIQVPIIGVGAGTKVDEASEFDAAYDSFVDQETERLLKRVERDAGVIACRDSFTQASLATNNHKTTLVGDCALFDPDYLGMPFHAPRSLRRIAFTAPRRPHLRDQALDALQMLQAAFPSAELLLFRHGRPNWTETQVEAKSGVRGHDVHGENTDTLRDYDDVDLHVGYRVHAHLYRLRTRRPSVLIEEDSRGVGFSRTLALEGIPSAHEGHPLTRGRHLGRRVVRRLGMDVPPQPQSSHRVSEQLRAVIARHMDTRFEAYEASLYLIDWYWEHRMRPFLATLP